MRVSNLIPDALTSERDSWTIGTQNSKNAPVQRKRDSSPNNSRTNLALLNNHFKPNSPVNEEFFHSPETAYERSGSLTPSSSMSSEMNEEHYKRKKKGIGISNEFRLDKHQIQETFKMRKSKSRLSLPASSLLLLEERFKLYEKEGLPPLPKELTIEYPPDIEAINSIKSTLQKSDKPLSASIWELFDTELNYFDQLTIIIKVYLAIFLDMHGVLFKEIEPSEVFHNVVEVYAASADFWKHSFEMLCSDILLNGENFRPTTLSPGFLKIFNYLRTYREYCENIETIQSKINRLKEENIDFKNYLDLVDCSGYVKRHKLQELIVVPAQRITRYPLLFENIKKSCHPGQLDLMEKIVDSSRQFALYLNSCMKNAMQRGEIQILDENTRWETMTSARNLIKEIPICSRLNSHIFRLAAPIDFSDIDQMLKVFVKYFSESTINVRPEIGGFKEIVPIYRKIVYESPVQMTDNLSPSNRFFTCHWMLFTDCLLIRQTSSGNQLIIIRNPIPLHQLVLAESSSSQLKFYQLTEFNTIGNVYICNCTESFKEWDSYFRKAKDDWLAMRSEYMRQKLAQLMLQSDSEPTPRSPLILPTDRRSTSGGSLSEFPADSASDVETVGTGLTTSQSMLGRYSSARNHFDNNSILRRACRGAPVERRSTLKSGNFYRPPTPSNDSPNVTPRRQDEVVYHKVGSNDANRNDVDDVDSDASDVNGDNIHKYLEDLYLAQMKNRDASSNKPSGATLVHHDAKQGSHSFNTHYPNPNLISTDNTPWRNTLQ